LPGKLLSAGADKCDVTSSDHHESIVHVSATCTPGTPDAFGSRDPKGESIWVRKIGDKTINLRRVKLQKDVDQQLSYCGQEAQNMYAQQKAKK